MGAKGHGAAVAPCSAWASSPQCVQGTKDRNIPAPRALLCPPAARHLAAKSGKGWGNATFNGTFIDKMENYIGPYPS